MILPNNPKVLASTHNLVSNTKMFSVLVDFPTVLLAELRTHRILTQGSLYEHMELDDFNMSANSARAIPSSKYLEKVLSNPFVPIWTKQQKGMSGELLDDSEMVTDIWVHLLNGYNGYDMKSYYDELLTNNVHKQNANRLLAPYAYTTCILSGTEWDNFFALRCPKYQHLETNAHGYLDTTLYNSKKAYLKAFPFMENIISTRPEMWDKMNQSSAQPEFQVIAEMIYDLYCDAKWKNSKYHIPFENDIIFKYCNEIPIVDSEEEYYNIIMKVSASMCAKLSYNTQDSEDTLEKHLERATMLIEHKHWEPFSHQAITMNDDNYYFYTRSFNTKHREKYSKRVDCEIYSDNADKTSTIVEYGHCYNLRGFISQRYMLENL